MSEALHVLFGGSFDPIHDGHLALGQEVLKVFPHAHVHFLPTGQNPLKPQAGTSPQARYEMLALALEEVLEPRFSLLDWEIKSPPPHYSIQAVERALLLWGAPVAFLLGNEVFSQLPRWHKGLEIAKLCDWIIVRRSTSPVDSVSRTLATLGFQDTTVDATGNLFWYAGQTRWIHLLNMNPVDLSSTTLRTTLKATTGKDFTPQGLRRSVWQYIKENQLYAVE